MRKEVENWFKQAQADLKTAKDCLKDGNFYASAFFSEQCAEKVLKAYFVYSRKDIAPKTHNLFELASGLHVPEEFVRMARRLTPAFIITRYPDAAGGVPAELYDEKTANEAFSEAEAIFGWVKAKLKQ